VAKINKTFYFNSETDADILDFLARQGTRNESQTVRDAIRKILEQEPEYIEAQIAKLEGEANELKAKLPHARANVPIPEHRRNAFLAPEKIIELLRLTKPPTDDIEKLFYHAYRIGRRGNAQLVIWANPAYKAETRRAGFKDIQSFAEAVITAYDAVFDNKEFKGMIPEGYAKADK